MYISQLENIHEKTEISGNISVMTFNLYLQNNTLIVTVRYLEDPDNNRVGWSATWLVGIYIVKHQSRAVTLYTPA